MGNINAMIQWFEERQGKVYYSQNYRNGPNSYDCSSAVFYALIAGGFLPPKTYIGNTESLYLLEGSLLLPIEATDVRRGDIFVAGKKGASSGDYGHTGVALDNGRIIHCNGSANGISTTPSSTRYTGTPVHWYRLAGTTDVVDNIKEDDSMTEFAFAYHGAMYYVVGLKMVLLRDETEWHVLQAVYTAVKKQVTGGIHQIYAVDWTNNQATADAYFSLCHYGDEEAYRTNVTEGIEAIKAELAKRNSEKE